MRRFGFAAGVILSGAVLRADIPQPEVRDVFRPLPPGAVRFNGGFGREIALCRDNWCLGDMPDHELERVYREGRPFMAMGEMWGKFFRTSAMYYRYEPLPALRERIVASVGRVLEMERPNGSISCAEVAAQPDFRGGDLWERKYVMLALERYYECVDRDPKVLASLRRQADAILAQIGSGEGQREIFADGFSYNFIESATIAEPMMRLYFLTGDRRYLDFVRYILESGGARGCDLIQEAIDGVRPCRMGCDYPKAYDMLSLFEGVVEYYRATGDRRYRTAALRLFGSVNAREITLIGNGGGDWPYSTGMGGEGWCDTAFEQTNPKMNRMMETCTGVTWLKYCSQILRLTGDSAAMDAIEKYAYNGLLGAMKPDGCGFSYCNLLNGAKTTNSGWGWSFGSKRVTCCNLNGPLGFAYLPYVAVMDSDEGPVVNLYNALSARCERADLTLKTDFPSSGRVEISVDRVKTSGRFSIRLRIPAWSLSTKVSVNGKPETTVRAGDYLPLVREWRDGDVVTLDLDMRVRLVPGPQGSASGSADFQAVTAGPLVLSRDERLDRAFSEKVSVVADASDVIAAKPLSLSGYRQAYEVPVSGGSIRMVDYASVDCWDGNRIMTWLPLAAPDSIIEGSVSFECSDADLNRRFKSDPAVRMELFCRYLGVKMRGDWPWIGGADVNPQPLDGLVWAKGTLTTARGPIVVRWRKGPSGDVVESVRMPWGIWGNASAFVPRPIRRSLRLATVGSREDAAFLDDFSRIAASLNVRLELNPGAPEDGDVVVWCGEAPRFGSANAYLESHGEADEQAAFMLGVGTIPVESVGRVAQNGREETYLRALIWAAELFGVDVARCRYHPDSVERIRADRLKVDAMRAVLRK